jgi:hypothetical protein
VFELLADSRDQVCGVTHRTCAPAVLADAALSASATGKYQFDDGSTPATGGGNLADKSPHHERSI